MMFGLDPPRTVGFNMARQMKTKSLSHATTSGAHISGSTLRKQDQIHNSARSKKGFALSRQVCALWYPSLNVLANEPINT
jgi:hypothetical protein